MHRLPLIALALSLLCNPVAAQGVPESDEVSTPDPFGIWSTLRRLDEIIDETPPAVWPRKMPAADVTTDASLLRDAMRTASDPGVRTRAVETESGTDALNQALNALADPAPAVRQAAIKVLEESESKTLAIAVADRLALGEAWQSDALYAALPQLGDVLTPPMLALFQDERETSLYRQAAAWALGRLGGDNVGDALAESTWSDDTALAEAAAQALYLLHEPERAMEWSDLLLHPSPTTRTTAMRALGEQGNDLALQNLAMVARGEVGLEPAMQLLALDAVAQWPLQQCAPLIIEAMKRNLTVRRRGRDHLRFRTGLDLSDMPSEWEFALYGTRPQDPNQPAGPVTEDAPSELLQEVNFVPPHMRGGVKIEYFDE